MKAWCINLDRRPDRWERMLAEGAKVGLVLDRLSAVDGKHPDVARAAEAIEPSRYHPGTRLGTSAFACFQSHRAAWQRLAESDDSHAMVLEDDLLLSARLEGLQQPDWIPADADVVKLETWLNRTHVSRRAHGELGAHRLHRLMGTHVGGGCYVLSRSAAQRMLRETERFSDPVDQYLFNIDFPVLQWARIYQMVPAPAVQGQRLDPASEGEGWVASSNLIQWQVESGVIREAREGRAARLRRRLTEEARALARRSRYILVPFG